MEPSFCDMCWRPELPENPLTEVGESLICRLCLRLEALVDRGAVTEREAELVARCALLRWDVRLH